MVWRELRQKSDHRKKETELNNRDVDKWKPPTLHNRFMARFTKDISALAVGIHRGTRKLWFWGHELLAQLNVAHAAFGADILGVPLVSVNCGETTQSSASLSSLSVHFYTRAVVFKLVGVHTNTHMYTYNKQNTACVVTRTHIWPLCGHM